MPDKYIRYYFYSVNTPSTKPVNCVSGVFEDMHNKSPKEVYEAIGAVISDRFNVHVQEIHFLAFNKV